MLNLNIKRALNNYNRAHTARNYIQYIIINTEYSIIGARLAALLPTGGGLADMAHFDFSLLFTWLGWPTVSFPGWLRSTPLLRETLNMGIDTFNFN